MFLTVTILLISCHNFSGKNTTTLLPHEKNTTCKKYLKSLLSSWQKNDKGYYDFSVKSFASYSEFRQNTNICFQEFSVEMLKEHLGEPNIETPTKMTYYITEACLTRDRDCNIQVFKIENGIFKETLLMSPKPFGTH